VKLGCCVAVFAPGWVAFGQQNPPPFVNTAPYVLSAAIAPPAGDKITSFDISWVDPVRHRYYLANRTSKAIIVVDTTTNTVVGNFKPGFKGFAGSNDTAGPDGVLTTETELWVGDAPSQVWALDPNTGAPVISPISTSATSQNRADEGCYDPVHKVVAFVNNADSPPFITFISTTTHSVVGQVAFDGTHAPKATNGSEQCQWNPRDGNIYLSIPEIDGAGDNSSPGGVVVFDLAEPHQPVIVRTMIVPLDACTGPQGLAIGPDGPVPQIGLGCNVGLINGQTAANTAIISDQCTHPVNPANFNQCDANVVHVFPNDGGGDEIWYDPGNNKYFFAARQAPGGEALFIFDAATFAVQRLFTGTLSNAHSVAADPFTNMAYVPTSSAATSGLCSLKGAVDANGCILVFAPQSQLAVASHDFNGDSKSDIAWRQTGGSTAIWLMNGAQVLQSGGLGTVASNWQIVGQRDFNHDHKFDLLWRDGTSGAVAIWLLNGLQVAQAGGLGAVASNWTIVGTGDFNGDGKGDILWRDSTTGTIGIWFMNGLQILQTGSLGTVTSNWQIAGTGDFNADGISDILWRDTSTGTVAIWVLNGLNVVKTASLGALASNWTIAGTGDFNGDGYTDILWRDNSGVVAIWLTQNLNVSQSGALGAVSSNWTIALTGDFDGDRKSDILWRDATGGTVAMWFINALQVSSTAIAGVVTTDWTIQGLNAD
jgi:hypothetical protein